MSFAGVSGSSMPFAKNALSRKRWYSVGARNDVLQVRAQGHRASGVFRYRSAELWIGRLRAPGRPCSRNGARRSDRARRSHRVSRSGALSSANTAFEALRRGGIRRTRPADRFVRRSAEPGSPPTRYRADAGRRTAMPRLPAGRANSSPGQDHSRSVEPVVLEALPVHRVDVADHVRRVGELRSGRRR